MVQVIVRFWTTYFKSLDLHVFEHAVHCGKSFHDSHPDMFSLHLGDQASASDLREMIKRSSGRFDIIVDDGGHTMQQQITSLNVLFPVLVPGGLYFVEDLETSFLEKYGGGPSGSNGTTLSYIKSLIDTLFVGDGSNVDDSTIPRSSPLLGIIRSIDCFSEICVLQRKYINE